LSVKATGLKRFKGGEVTAEVEVSRLS
jgi:hypothetical protein